VALRRLRREIYHLERPSAEEIEIMEKALELSPNNPNNLRCMTLLYHDIIKGYEYNCHRYDRVAGPDPPDKLTDAYRRGKDKFVLQMQIFAR